VFRAVNNNTNLDVIWPNYRENEQTVFQIRQNDFNLTTFDDGMTDFWMRNDAIDIENVDISS